MTPPRKPTIAITGANGFVGSVLIEHFAAKGWQVVALVRQPKPATKSIEYVAYDLVKPLDPEALKGVDYLVHAAYVKQDRRHPEAFNTNINAAKNILEAARKNKLKKCLFMSSMSAHDEAISAYGKQKLAIEKLFNGTNCVSVRSGLIIGNGGIVKQMTDFMRSKHMVPLVGGGKQPVQIVSVNDLALAIDKLLTSDLAGTFTVATPEIYTYKQLYQAISDHIHTKVLFVPIPFFALINLIRFINLLPVPMAVNPDNALGLKALRSADTAADLKKIGVRLRSLQSALEETA